MSDWKVDVPTGTIGSATIDRFEISERDAAFAVFRYGARTPSPGTYTRLTINGRTIMSDTVAEWRDHDAPIREIRRRGGRVLIAGLGIGMVVKAALECDRVEHVDVVEINHDVIDLVGPTYAGDRCTIHHGDIFDIMWLKGTRWQVAWWDIWPDICGDNVDEMIRLHRSYGRRVDWQGSWARKLCEQHR